MIEDIYTEIKLKEFRFMIRTKPNTDKGLIEGVVLKNEYCLEEIDFKGIKTIVDIGGHVGSFSITHSKYVENVIAFEPEPVSYKLFTDNLILNNIKNVSLINKAVSANKGKLKFHLGATSGRNTLCELGYTHQKGELEVDCEDINEVFKLYKINTPSLLKVDIEGIEYELFEKINKESLDKIKIIVFEAHQYPDKQWSYFSIIKTLENKGFTIVKVKPITVNKNVCAFNLKALKNE